MRSRDNTLIYKTMPQITDMHGTVHNVATNAKANTAVALGAVGAGLGLFNNNGCGNGLLGGLFGGNRNACYVTEKEAALQMQIAALEAKNQAVASATQAFTDSANYTNRLHDEQAVSIKTLFDQAVVQGVAIQRIDDKIDTQVALIKGEIATQSALAAKDREALSKDIQIEAERRCCADNAIVNYANQTFYVQQIADVNTKNTTSPETKYNPIPSCKPCSPCYY